MPWGVSPQHTILPPVLFTSPLHPQSFLLSPHCFFFLPPLSSCPISLQSSPLSCQSSNSRTFLLSSPSFPLIPIVLHLVLPFVLSKPFPWPVPSTISLPLIPPAYPFKNAVINVCVSQTDIVFILSHLPLNPSPFPPVQ